MGGTTTRDRDGESGRDREYVVRAYEPRDRPGFLALMDATPELSDPSAAWFDWKYGANPATDTPAIFVATHDGEMVGARPFVPFRMRAGDDVHLALQTADTMVHPDHRRRGVFSEMTERALAYWSDTARYTFNVPNAQSREGYLGMGFEVAGDLTAHYRVQDPSALLDLSGGLQRAAGPLARFAARSALSARHRVGPDRDPDVSVVRHDEVPVDRLAALYGRAVPPELHALRDEAFYGWRFGNPRWTYDAYTAERGGEPVAGLVAATAERHGVRETRIVDSVPRVDPDRDALAALVRAALADSRESATVSALGDTLPRGVRRQFGFLPDDRPPFGLVSSPTTLVASTFDGWQVGGRDLRERDSYRLAFVELNTG